MLAIRNIGDKRERLRLVFLLLVALFCWNAGAEAAELRNLPAELCQQLGHHSLPVPAGMACCPPPGIALTQHSAGNSCCQVSRPSQEPIPAEKNRPAPHAAAYVKTTAIPLPAQSTQRSAERLHDIGYKRDVFALKTDMRI